MKKQFFQFAVLFHPTKEGYEKGEHSKALVEIKTIFASDAKEAGILAAREIPAEYLDKLDQVEIAVRPF